MPNSEKNCPHCAETILAEATKCKHCGSDLRPKRAIWPWVGGVPAAALAAMLVIGGNIPEEKTNAREAISTCWEGVDDELQSVEARRMSREICRSMVNSFESKYGYSPSLRRD